jgi:hypothetical protein
MPAASHWAATSTNANAAPVSLHLKASFDISQFSAANQVILRTLQQYGWNNDDLHNLDEVNASDFEVVEISPIYTQTICRLALHLSSLASRPAPNNVSAGTQVTLAWSATVTGTSYYDLTRQIGAIR